MAFLTAECATDLSKSLKKLPDPHQAAGHGVSMGMGLVLLHQLKFAK
jgi:hypothetical protein